MTEVFNEVVNEIKANKGKFRAVHIVLKDKTDHVILRISDKGERTGEYCVNSVYKYVTWLNNGGNFREKHITPFDSILDVYLNTLN